jgi:O-antigen ligase
LGGGTKQGLWSDAAVQIAALFLLAISLPGIPWRNAPRVIIPFTIGLAAIAVPLLQLVPIPFEVWSTLPGRATFVAGFRAAGLDLTWLPVSLDPAATQRAAFSLLPPLAIFLAVVRLGFRARRTLTLILVAAGFVSVVMGLGQVMQGPASSLRFFPITNPTQSVGFFANRNHYAALLYSLIPFTAAWLIGLLQDRRPERWFGLAMCLITLATLVVGLGMAQSRAGVLLAMLTLAASLFVAARGSGGGAGLWRTLAAVAAAAVVGLIYAVQTSYFAVLARFNDGIVDEFRLKIAKTTISAARVFEPVGSGLGTFVPIYQMFERPDALLSSYVNHAHNDWVELWLEGGWPAVAVLGVFLLWFVVYAAKAWWRGEGTAVDAALSRAATVAVVALLLHSAVDYPLRTTALMVLLAFSCALMISPVVVSVSPALPSFPTWRGAVETLRRRRRTRRAGRWAKPARV